MRGEYAVKDRVGCDRKKGVRGPLCGRLKVLDVWAWASGNALGGRSKISGGSSSPYERREGPRLEVELPDNMTWSG